ncbi:IclR family transcriptional regulator [Micrococcales bacterium 31B]|nr:IclR family transcriptional regulator [Micrococcales bacterium 31B]
MAAGDIPRVEGAEREVVVPVERAQTDRVHSVHRTLQLLETVAACGGCSARHLSSSLGMPLPTVYRLAQELIASGYLVHLRSQQRFELGYKVYELGLKLHQQIGVTRGVREAIDSLHARLGTAAYYAIYRGTDVVIAYVSDCGAHPRLAPLSFGFHEAAHATAFGKVMLAGLAPNERDAYLFAHGTPRLTAATRVRREDIEADLDRVRREGIAWERGEFLEGYTCAAVAVRDRSGLVIGSVAISAATDGAGRRDADLERELREHALLLGSRQRARVVQERTA